jgi:hypothetical protein
MEVIRQVYEDSPAVITITVPEELRHQRVEVIVQALENDLTLEQRAAAVGLKLEEVADLHGLRFVGCLPDFPPRGPQGDYETRADLP